MKRLSCSHFEACDEHAKWERPMHGLCGRPRGKQRKVLSYPFTPAVTNAKSVPCGSYSHDFADLVGQYILDDFHPIFLAFY